MGLQWENHPGAIQPPDFGLSLGKPKRDILGWFLAVFLKSAVVPKLYKETKLLL